MLQIPAFTALNIQWRFIEAVIDQDAFSSNADSSDKHSHMLNVNVKEQVPDHIFDRFTEGFGDEDVTSLDASEYGEAECYDWLETFKQHGLVEADICCKKSVMVTLVPRKRNFDIPLHTEASTGWALSRFSYVQNHLGGFCLREPDATCDVLIRDRQLQLRLFDASFLAKSECDEATASVLDLLGAFGFLTPAKVNRSDPWEFHDRLFYSQIRPNDDFSCWGGTFRFGKRPYQQPDTNDDPWSSQITLPKPTNSPDRPFVDVLESRRSKRDISESAVQFNAVSNLLYRACRNIAHTPCTSGDVYRRPYPSAGGIHELVFYLAVRNCDGLQPGFYRYDGEAHTLSELDLGKCQLASLFDQIRSDADPKETNAAGIVLVISQFPRLAWKYEKIAGQLTMLNAGAALQTLHLVATDLGLGGWIIGNGFQDICEAATGRSDRQEIAIASFAFGDTD